MLYLHDTWPAHNENLIKWNLKNVHTSAVFQNWVTYRTAGYCCEVQIFATLLKWPLAEIFAIAKFARKEADFHWIENAWAKFYSLENIRISLFQQKFLRVKPLFANFAKFGPRTHNSLYGI